MVDFDELFKHVNFEEIKYNLELFKKMDLKQVQFKEIRDQVGPILQCGLDTIDLNLDEQIFRSRVYDPRKESLSHTGQISYNPSPSPGRYNRVTSMNNPIFYGALSCVNNGAEIGHHAAWLEVSDFVKDSNPGDEEYSVVGRWKVNDHISKANPDEIKVAVLGANSMIAGNNASLQEVKKKQEDIFTRLPNSYAATFREVHQFISYELSKTVLSENEYQYKISAAIGDILIDMGFAAIMYPSVKTDGKSINIALRNDIVDQYLTCEVAAISRTHNLSQTIAQEYHLISERIKSDGSFDWKVPPPESTMSNFDKKQIEKS